MYVCMYVIVGIIAKWTRDTQMTEYHRRYPHYGFDSNVGYGSDLKHLQAIYDHGICPIHRRSFEPIKTLVESPDGRAKLKKDYIDEPMKRKEDRKKNAMEKMEQKKKAVQSIKMQTSMV
jgi:hypothetical protein